MSSDTKKRLVTCPVCRTVNRAGTSGQVSCGSCGNALPPPTKFLSKCPSCGRSNNIGTNRETVANCAVCTARLGAAQGALVTCLGCGIAHQIAIESIEPAACTKCGRALPVPDQEDSPTVAPQPSKAAASPSPAAKPTSEGSEYWDRIGLFDNPVWKDPAFFVGWTITVLLAVSRVVAVGQRGFSSTPAGITSGLLDGVLAVGTSVLLFCVLPAFIRQLLRKGRLRKAQPAATTAQWLPDPVRRGQLRLWEGSRWSDKARGGRPRHKQAGVTWAIVAVGALLVALAAALSATAGASQAAKSQAAEQDAASAYSQLLADVSTFESGAQSAARNGGPNGLAEYVMGHANTIFIAATRLENALNVADLPQSYVPDPDLLSQAARAGMDYGREIQLLANDLEVCAEGNVACYQAAFEAGDDRANSGREQLIAVTGQIEGQILSS